MRLFFVCVVFLGLFTSGCASIVEGSSQEVVVNTNPSDAYCKLMREGMPVGEITKTPGAVTIKKTKHDLTIECSKEGFHKSTYYNKSAVEGATFGNIILGGGIGWAIDSASGSDNKYTSPVNLTLVPLSEEAPAPVYSEQEEKSDEEEVKPEDDYPK